MASAFPAPLIVRTDQSSFALERVPLTGPEAAGEYSEAWLQGLLYRHPQALPIAEIDDSFSGAHPVCREMETPAGPIDALFMTPSGRPVIVEAKLWRNPGARRRVVAQILDYAKELSRWSYETLDAAVRRARRSEDGGNPKGLAEAMGIPPGSEQQARFFDSVSQNLKRGDLLLLIVGDGIREGVGTITEFLEGHGSLHFTFGLVEMAIFRLPDGGHLVQPRVLAQSTIVRRIVVDLRHESIEIADPEGTEEQDAAAGPESVAARDAYHGFWSEFLAKLRLDNREQPVRPAAKSTNQYFAMPKGSEAWVGAYLAQSFGRAGVYLTFSKGPIGDRLYAALRDEREEIERALGVPVEWESDGRKNWIVSGQSYSGSLIEDHAQELQATMADRVNRYVNVFRPRLQKLVEQVT